jgi:adenylate kinase
MTDPPNLRAVLIAPPGAGKSTQGDRLAVLYDVPHISVGEVLRKHFESGTTAGTSASDALEQGRLAPDALVLATVRDELSKAPGGFILDGFPRTLAQAIAAEQRALLSRRPLHAAIELEVPDNELVDRLAERSLHSSRLDDASDTIAYRLALYRRNAEDLLAYYRQREILITIDGTGAVDEVTDRIRQRLDHVLLPPRMAT